MNTTTEKIDRLLAEHLGVPPAEIIPDALLVPAHDQIGRKLASDQTDLGCDSLDIVEIVMVLEDEFGIEIPDDDADKLNTGTVGDLHALICAKVGQDAA